LSGLLNAKEYEGLVI